MTLIIKASLVLRVIVFHVIYIALKFITNLLMMLGSVRHRNAK